MSSQENYYLKFRHFIISDVLGRQPSYTQHLAVYDLLNTDGGRHDRTTIAFGNRDRNHVKFYDYRSALPTIPTDEEKAP